MKGSSLPHPTCRRVQPFCKASHPFSVLQCERGRPTYQAALIDDPAHVLLWIGGSARAYVYMGRKGG